ncbi:MAG: shikimate kinase [Pyrinomonadaceae bacterium]
MKDRQIIITGFMGSGKSAVAQALARILECVALDLDYEITQREQRGPKEIIEIDGESAFREIETQTLSKVLKEVLETDAAHVIALGGGTFTIERNREIIRTHNCHTVWLDVPFDLCWKRILSSGDERPLARNESEARSLYRERHDSYRRAELHVEASENTSADQIAEEIARLYRLEE